MKKEDPEPIRIPLPSRKKQVGVLTHIEVEAPPHPRSVQCSVCMAHRGQLCYDDDYETADPFERSPRLKGGYHAERVRWARELAVKLEKERKEHDKARGDSGDGDH